MAQADTPDEETAGDEPQYKRQLAHRVFAMELNATQLEMQPGDSERAPRFAVLPLGVKCNRVVVCGEVVEKSRDKETNREKALIADGADGPSFYMYAGQFYPESRDQMARIDEGELVSVTGKPRVYEGNDGDMLVAVRPESFTTIDEVTRQRWVRDAARWTNQRAERLVNYITNEPKDTWPDEVSLTEDYYLAEGGSDVEQFVQPFRSAAADALRNVCSLDAE